MAVRNGTGPVDLICAYQIDENENGLVIKWFHEAYQIYQWIPPSNLQSCPHPRDPVITYTSAPRYLRAIIKFTYRQPRYIRRNCRDTSRSVLKRCAAIRGKRNVVAPSYYSVCDLNEKKKCKPRNKVCTFARLRQKA